MKLSLRNLVTSPRTGAFVGFTLAALSVSGVASAQGEERSWRNGYEPSRYSLEVEPHFAFGAENVYGATGFGGGVRFGVPIADGVLRRTPDNFAISFGADFLHYDNCYYGANCGANYLDVPVALQWNVFVAHRLSLFAEGGAFFYKGFFDGCGPAEGPGCNAPSDLGVLPTLAIGMRVHMGDNAAFTMRLGYPTVTLGVSFL